MSSLLPTQPMAECDKVQESGEGIQDKERFTSAWLFSSSASTFPSLQIVTKQSLAPTQGLLSAPQQITSNKGIKRKRKERNHLHTDNKGL